MRFRTNGCALQGCATVDRWISLGNAFTVTQTCNRWCEIPQCPASEALMFSTLFSKRPPKAFEIRRNLVSEAFAFFTHLVEWFRGRKWYAHVVEVSLQLWNAIERQAISVPSFLRNSPRKSEQSLKCTDYGHRSTPAYSVRIHYCCNNLQSYCPESICLMKCNHSVSIGHLHKAVYARLRN